LFVAIALLGDTRFPQGNGHGHAFPDESNYRAHPGSPRRGCKGKVRTSVLFFSAISVVN
jgi:hypothetical protein